MSQRDNFAAGFVAGTILGGFIGGVLGVLATSSLRKSNDGKSVDYFESDAVDGLLGDTTEAKMESARRGLENKIAQLNEAIDDVRQQLGGSNGHSHS